MSRYALAVSDYLRRMSRVSVSNCPDNLLLALSCFLSYLSCCSVSLACRARRAGGTQEFGCRGWWVSLPCLPQCHTGLGWCDSEVGLFACCAALGCMLECMLLGLPSCQRQSGWTVRLAEPELCIRLQLGPHPHEVSQRDQRPESCVK